MEGDPDIFWHPLPWKILIPSKWISEKGGGGRYITAVKFPPPFLLIFFKRVVYTAVTFSSPYPSFFPPISKKWITFPKFEYILNIFDLICGRGPDIPPPPHPTHTYTILGKFYFRSIFYCSWHLVNESFPVLKILWYQMCRGSWKCLL